MLVDASHKANTAAGNTKACLTLLRKEDLNFESRIKASLAVRKSKSPLKLDLRNENTVVKKFAEKFLLPVIAARYKGKVIVAL